MANCNIAFLNTSEFLPVEINYDCESGYGREGDGYVEKSEYDNFSLSLMEISNNDSGVWGKVNFHLDPKRLQKQGAWGNDNSL